MTSLKTRFNNAPRELRLFLIASLVMGMAYSLIDATLNNFLNDRFALTGFQRSFLEFPREIPGFLTVFVSALLFFLCSRRLGVLSLLLGAVGSLLMGFVSPSYGVIVIWLFIYSLGQHLLMPVSSTIGMELAHAGQTGQRLGQLNAVRNLATIIGSFVVFLGFRFLGFSYTTTFTLAAVGLALAAALMYAMKPDEPRQRGEFLKLKSEYRLYYVLAVLYGSRKQLFITFAPWVIVTIFHQPTQVLATLLTIGGVIGILFQPILGRAIDRFGERAVLITEAVSLMAVCFMYGYARNLFAEHTAFLVTCVCYLLDQMLFSINMARSTYMKKIARRPEDVQPALTAAQTIDHFFSISIALIGGAIWSAFGYQYVFMMGAFIALLNLLAALRIRLPHPGAGVPSPAVPAEIE